jgi:hypothetical protein
MLAKRPPLPPLGGAFGWFGELGESWLEDVPRSEPSPFKLSRKESFSLGMEG